MTTCTTILVGAMPGPDANASAEEPVLAATVNGDADLEAVGATLLQHYASCERVVELLERGHHTFLGPSPADGAAGGQPTPYGSRDAFLNALAGDNGAVAVLYEDGQWDVYDTTGHRGRLDVVIA